MSKFNKTKKITTLAMLTALAYLVMVMFHIKLVPDAPYLTYDPKDVILVITGFLAGPVAGMITTLVVGLVEMVTVSDSGPWGLLMNVLSSWAFVIPASFVYKKNKKISGAIVGLILSVICMTGMMLLWNYLITPIYQGVPRDAVAAMLIPIFLPFNLLKASINMAFTLIIYKPVVKALRRAGFVEPSSEKAASAPAKRNFSGIIIGIVILGICAAVVFLIK